MRRSIVSSTGESKRGGFTSRVGFVLSAAGSAVGLGNLWRFPYLAAKYGGGIFLLVYLILAVTFGFALMITEVAIGRKTKQSCIGAFRSLNRKFSFLGWMAAIIPVIIAPYYCVIGGWVLKYFVDFLTGQGTAAAGDTYFKDFISVSSSGLIGNPMFWFGIYIVLNAVVVLFGVQKGVEKASRILMPMLVVLIVVVTVYSLTLPGALEGVRFYLLPDLSRFSPMTVLGAVGQMFYSMSLAMGIMITYGSYMSSEDDLERSVSQIEIFDTGIAFLAGLLIVPAVVAFSGGDTTLVQQSAGSGLMFGVLPKVFDSMPFGGAVGAVFFMLVLFAALTSSISLLETIVSLVEDNLHWQRRKATIVVSVGLLILGIPSCLGYGPLSFVSLMGMAFLDFFDFISNSVLMPIVALLTCVLVGHIVGTDVVSSEVKMNGHVFKREKLFKVMIRWVAPILLLVVLISSVADKFAIGGFVI
ncbi:MAG TPA: sodium-dependent transporter [Candidatus Faecivivens stercoripullorum]|uniref:Transporter n=1 Tax=Candidatus Faecivivens stercoripullorum TaxID=2840805 RepID=A0A9D1H6E6_9FIRM|nr:sodium-dependent transporter [Candidatus Faecivivens stercoripullorum]